MPDSLSFVLYAVPIIADVIIFVLIAFGSRGITRNKVFLLPIAFVTLWLAAQLLAQIFPSLGLGLVRLSIAFASIMVFTFYEAVKVYTQSKRSIVVDVALGLLSIVFAGLSLSNLSVLAVSASARGISINSASSLYIIQLIVIVGIIAIALFDLIRASHKLPSPNQRTGNYVMFGATLQILVIDVVLSLFAADVAYIQILFYISGTLFAMGIFVGIFRYGLFDVREAVVRTMSYTLVLAVLAATYYLLAYGASRLLFGSHTTAGISLNPLNVLLALTLAFIFQPIRRFFDRVTNAIFYRGTYQTGELIDEIARILTSSVDLRSILTHVSARLSEALKSDGVYFVVRGKNGHILHIGNVNPHGKLASAELEAFDKYAVEHGYLPLIDASDDKSDWVHRRLATYRLSILVPLASADQIVGYIAVGQHKTGNYQARDIRLLQTLSNELVIAIENALSVKEVRDLNSTLQQRVDNATRELRLSNAQLRRLDEAKDDFISMASHQLRTPLTSVKGYISMVLEGDAGKVSAQQRQLLGQAFDSSERMVHLINDFLNVSRLQTGKFVIDKQPVDLAKAVTEELAGLATNAAARKMKFSYRAPKNLPLLNLDDSKIRQVIMNYADNAVYYAKEGSTIHVDLAKKGKEVVFTVKDTGIGVPVDQQHQLFTKFFRATNARHQRPDGTGVGLFLAKKVIDGHDGQIIFESKENRGSTFGFRLPLARLTAKQGASAPSPAAQPTPQSESPQSPPPQS